MDIKGTAKTTTEAMPASPLPAGAPRGGATLKFEKIETSAQFRDQKMDIIGMAKTTMSTVPSAPLLLTEPAGAHYRAVGGVTLRFEKNRDRCLETRPYFCFINMPVIALLL